MQAGQQLGHYTVSAALGRGGMGEVWRARDTKLGREVAIKTLSAELARDGDRLARLEREARLLASLNHPNIAGIYGLEEDRGQRFLVLELVEGPTLAERIAQGPIPVDDSLKFARQIAEALEAAHERDVIHRDLKPANIKITGRHGESPGLRACQGTGAGGAGNQRLELADAEPGGDSTRRHSGYGGIHGAGTGERPVGRQARRHLGVRLRCL